MGGLDRRIYAISVILYPEGGTIGSRDIRGAEGGLGDGISCNAVILSNIVACRI